VIVVDTNVISELVRPQPDPGVVAWVARHPSSTLFTTTITQAEILYGVAVLPTGRRRTALEAAIEAIFTVDLAGRVIPFDADAARAYATLAARRRSLGRPIAQLDGQIGAIAKSRGASLATRNVADFADCDVTLVNPWPTG
jgi:hypothetical protein